MNTIEVKISDITIGDRFRKDLGDLEGLAQSISEGELLQPIGITPDHELVFGERRLRAYRDILGRETIPARIVDVPSVLLGQIDENVLRKEFTLTEQIAIVDSLGPFTHGGDRRSNQARNSSLGSLTLADACKLVGISEDTYRRTKVVIEHGVPELAEAMDAKELSVHAAETLAQAPANTQKFCLSKGFNEQKPTAKAIKRIIRQAELDQQQTLAAATTPIILPNDGSSADIHIWCGDCLSLMRDRVSPDSVEVVVTSIPYNIGVEYATYDDNRPEAEYLAWMDEVFSAIKRLLKNEGSFFLNVGGTRRQPWTAMRVAEVAGRHFVLQNEIVWVKAITVDGRSHGHFTPLNGNRFLNQNWERVFHFTKTGDVKLDRLSIGVPYEDKGNLRRNRAEQDCRCGGDVWFIPHETTRDRSAKEFHPCVFPVELPERCIRLHGVKAEMVVLDPFNGVGGTTLAAARLGVKGIGIDLSPAYCKAAEKRLSNQFALPMVSVDPVVINSVVEGDCRDVIPRLPDNSIGLSIVSPPYAQQRDGLYPGVPEKDYPAFTVDWMTKLWPKLTEDGSVLIPTSRTACWPTTCSAPNWHSGTLDGSSTCR